MKLIKCRMCLPFAKDAVFQNVRTRLTEKGINWKSIKPLKPELRRLIPLGLDHAFFDDSGFQIVVDARGYERQDISCEMSPDVVNIEATRRTEMGDMSFKRAYKITRKFWNMDSLDCCMSTEGIVLVSGDWK